MVSYISELGTSKEMYDMLVSMFRANNAHEVLFFKNQLKNIKKGKEESIQSYFMRVTNWYVFNTPILNNNVILMKC